MILVTLTILVIFNIFLAKKDGLSFIMKDKNDSELIIKTLKAWHRDGVVIDLIFTLVLGYGFGNMTWILVQSLLARLAVYDVTFNYFAKLNYKYIGTTSVVDRFTRKIFGEEGAVKKAVLFFIILIIFSVLVQIK